VLGRHVPVHGHSLVELLAANVAREAGSRGEGQTGLWRFGPDENIGFFQSLNSL
jgi:hypothetical protein